MGRRIGYARVSTEDQDLSIQRQALERDNCAIVFDEKRSGKRRDDREQLRLALAVLTKGDTLVVTRLDRLGRSLRDLANIAHEVEDKGAHLRVLEQSVDTATSVSRAASSACWRCSPSSRPTAYAASARPKALRRRRRPACTRAENRE
ncbi:MAG: recombinase family protein [Hyphomicrobiaceae bacterium]